MNTNTTAIDVTIDDTNAIEIVIDTLGELRNIFY